MRCVLPSLSIPLPNEHMPSVENQSLRASKKGGPDSDTAADVGAIARCRLATRRRTEHCGDSLMSGATQTVEFASEGHSLHPMPNYAPLSGQSYTSDLYAAAIINDGRNGDRKLRLASGVLSSTSIEHIHFAPQNMLQHLAPIHSDTPPTTLDDVNRAMELTHTEVRITAE